jgi:hypothetical protein
MSNRAVLLLAMLLVCLLAGCGGGGDASTAGPGHPGKARREAAKQPATCKVGESILGFVPEAPAWWKEGTGPTLALACIHDRVATAVMLGYASPIRENAGVCVTGYREAFNEAPTEHCSIPEMAWTWSCHGLPGCVGDMMYHGGMTGLDGPLSQKVAAVRVLVRGKPLREGVAVAHVQGETLQLIDAEEPFGFFLAFVPGCVLPREVKVELLDDAGSRIGTARANSGGISCPKRS